MQPEILVFLSFWSLCSVHWFILCTWVVLREIAISASVMWSLIGSYKVYQQALDTHVGVPAGMHVCVDETAIISNLTSSCCFREKIFTSMWWNLNEKSCSLIKTCGLDSLFSAYVSNLLGGYRPSALNTQLKKKC